MNLYHRSSYYVILHHHSSYYVVYAVELCHLIFFCYEHICKTLKTSSFKTVWDKYLYYIIRTIFEDFKLYNLKHLGLWMVALQPMVWTVCYAFNFIFSRFTFCKRFLWLYLDSAYYSELSVPIVICRTAVWISDASLIHLYRG